MIVPVGAKIANAPSSLPEEKSAQFRHKFLRVAPSIDGTKLVDELL